MKFRDETRLIMVHCSATSSRQDIGRSTIAKWHLARGWSSAAGPTGYHFIIRRSGLIEQGRHMDAWGAHARGFNDVSVAVCLIGGAEKARTAEEAQWSGMVSKDNFTGEQQDSLTTLLATLKLAYPDAAIAAHNMVANKGCPVAPIYEWIRQGEVERQRALAIIADLRSGR